VGDVARDARWRSSGYPGGGGARADGDHGREPDAPRHFCPLACRRYGHADWRLHWRLYGELDSGHSHQNSRHAVGGGHRLRRLRSGTKGRGGKGTGCLDHRLALWRAVQPYLPSPDRASASESRVAVRLGGGLFASTLRDEYHLQLRSAFVGQGDHLGPPRSHARHGGA
jgi:hypothetical protein